MTTNLEERAREHKWKGDDHPAFNGSCCSCGWLCEGGHVSTCRAEWETHVALSQAEAREQLAACQERVLGEHFTNKEAAVIGDLAKRLGISEHKVLVQGLRAYQLIVMGTHQLQEKPPSDSD